MPLTMKDQTIDMPPQGFTQPPLTETQTPSANPDPFSFNSQTSVVRKRIRKICSLGAGYVVRNRNPPDHRILQEADVVVGREGQHAPS